MRKEHYEKALSLLLGTAGAVCVLACTDDFSLSADAAPATLKSQDAVVYEQADEESGPVGNLVEGSSFEYIGDVTSEDGAVWHQVATVDGISGYIKGDLEMEMGEEEALPEGPDIPEEKGNEPDTEDADEENRDESTGGGNEGVAPQTPEGDMGTDSPSGASDIRDMQNNRTKSYVLYGSDKIKKKEDLAEEDRIASDPAGAKAAVRIDTTLLFGIAVVLFCAGAIHVLCRRTALMLRQAKTGRYPDNGGNKKKKRSPRRKTRGNRKQG